MGRSQSRIRFINEPKCLNIPDLNLALSKITESYGKTIHMLIYEFVSRERIVEINTTHLNHNYETDVITFDYCDSKRITGEIYLCLDVISSNASDYKIDELTEIYRVVFHGLLHLLGYKDKTPAEILLMREKEDVCLKLMIGINE